MATRNLSEESREKLREAGRRGGTVTVTKYGTLYMAWIGTRGGRNEMARQWREMIPQAVDQEQKEYYEEKAASWQVDTGTKIMLDLWAGCETRPARRAGRGDISKLRRYQKSFQ